MLQWVAVYHFAYRRKQAANREAHPPHIAATARDPRAKAPDAVPTCTQHKFRKREIAVQLAGLRPLRQGSTASKYGAQALRISCSSLCDHALAAFVMGRPVPASAPAHLQHIVFVRAPPSTALQSEGKSRISISSCAGISMLLPSRQANVLTSSQEAGCGGLQPNKLRAKTTWPPEACHLHDAARRWSQSMIPVRSQEYPRAPSISEVHVLLSRPCQVCPALIREQPFTAFDSAKWCAGLPPRVRDQTVSVWPIRGSWPADGEFLSCADSQWSLQSSLAGMATGSYILDEPGANLVLHARTFALQKPRASRCSKALMLLACRLAALSLQPQRGGSEAGGQSLWHEDLMTKCSAGENQSNVKMRPRTRSVPELLSDHALAAFVMGRPVPASAPAHLQHIVFVRAPPSTALQSRGKSRISISSCAGISMLLPSRQANVLTSSQEAGCGGLQPNKLRAKTTWPPEACHLHDAARRWSQSMIPVRSQEYPRAPSISEVHVLLSRPCQVCPALIREQPFTAFDSAKWCAGLPPRVRDQTVSVWPIRGSWPADGEFLSCADSQWSLQSSLAGMATGSYILDEPGANLVLHARTFALQKPRASRCSKALMLLACRLAALSLQPQRGGSEAGGQSLWHEDLMTKCSTGENQSNVKMRPRTRSVPELLSDHALAAFVMGRPVPASAPAHLQHIVFVRAPPSTALQSGGKSRISISSCAGISMLLPSRQANVLTSSQEAGCGGLQPNKLRAKTTWPPEACHLHDAARRWSQSMIPVRSQEYPRAPSISEVHVLLSRPCQVCPALIREQPFTAFDSAKWCAGLPPRVRDQTVSVWPIRGSWPADGEFLSCADSYGIPPCGACAFTSSSLKSAFKERVRCF